MMRRSVLRPFVRACRALGRAGLPLLLVLFAIPSLLVKAHLAIDDHHAPGAGHSHAPGAEAEPGAHASAHADRGHASETPPEPTHPADEHAADELLECTHRRVAKGTPDALSLPPVACWTPIPREPRSWVMIAATPPDLPPRPLPLRARGPPRVS